VLAGFDPFVVVGAVLLVLLGLLSWLTRRVQGGALAGARERVALTSQHSVHVVELGGVRLLVGTGPSGAPRLLAELGAVEGAETGEVDGVDVRPDGRSPGRGGAELLARFGVAGGR
jgi:hypothetical protein